MVKNKLISLVLSVIVLIGGVNIMPNQKAHADDNDIGVINSKQIELRGIPENKEFKEYEINSYFEKDISRNISPLSEIVNENEEFIFHNNGDPIATDILIEKNGFELVALHKATIDGVNFVSYYYDNGIEDLQIEDIINDIKTKPIKVGQTNGFEEKSVYQSRSIHNDNWRFGYKGQNILSFTNSVEFTKRGATTINGKAGSVWDVSNVAQLEDIVNSPNGVNLGEQYTRLSMQPFNSQTLFDWGPGNDNNGGSVSANITGLNFPTFSFSYEIGKWKIQDLSSKTYKYGRWRYYTGPIAKIQRSFTTRTGLRATNTRGNFGLEISHTFKHGKGNYQTGIVQKFVADR